MLTGFAGYSGNHVFWGGREVAVRDRLGGRQIGRFVYIGRDVSSQTTASESLQTWVVVPELVCLMSVLPPTWFTSLKGQAERCQRRSWAKCPTNQSLDSRLLSNHFKILLFLEKETFRKKWQRCYSRHLTSPWPQSGTDYLSLLFCGLHPKELLNNRSYERCSTEKFSLFTIQTTASECDDEKWAKTSYWFLLTAWEEKAKKTSCPFFPSEHTCYNTQ